MIMGPVELQRQPGSSMGEAACQLIDSILSSVMQGNLNFEIGDARLIRIGDTGKYMVVFSVPTAEMAQRIQRAKEQLRAKGYMLRVDLSRHEKANKDRIQSHPDFVEAVTAILQEPKGGNSNIYWGLDTVDTVYRGQRTFWSVNTLRQLDSSSVGTQVRSFAAVTAGQGTPAAPATAPQQQQQQQQQQRQQQELLQQQEQQRQALLLQQQQQRQELLRQQQQQQRQQPDTLTPAALTADLTAVTTPAGGNITAPTPHPALTPAGRATAERAVAAGMATAAGTAAVGGAAAGTSSGVPIAAA
jgi:hypothetical protein